MLLERKKLLITGVLTPQSIAFAAARSAQEQGAEIVLTNFGRTVSLTEKTAKRLPDPPDVLELDVNEPEPDRRGPRRAQRAMGPTRRVPARDRVRAAGRAGRQLPQHRVGERRDRVPHERVLAEGARGRHAAADAGTRAARSSRSTSTRRSRGRSTTGWVWRRPGSSRSPATSPATSGRRASASTR